MNLSSHNNFSNYNPSMDKQSAYTDLNALNRIQQLGKENESLALREVAQQFESMFVSIMLKSMRAANDVFSKDNPLNTHEMKFHRDFYDQQLSLDLAKSNRIGLSDAFFRQMQWRYGNEENLESSETNVADNSIQQDFRKFTGSPSSTLSSYDQTYSGAQANTSDANRTSSNKKSHYNNDELDLSRISNQNDFITLVLPYAKTIAHELGVDPKVLVAQSALETGWGQHVIRDRYGKSSMNLFNIKADHRWGGHHVKVPTLEYRQGIAERETANFRRYDSIAQSFEDYREFLQQPRYQYALKVANNGEAYLSALQQAGYATDPNYADKISRIMNNFPAESFEEQL